MAEYTRENLDAVDPVAGTVKLSEMTSDGTGGGKVLIAVINASASGLPVSHPTIGMQLFFAGKLKVAGNQMLAMKLQKLFSYKA